MEPESITVPGGAIILTCDYTTNREESYWGIFTWKIKGYKIEKKTESTKFKVTS